MSLSRPITASRSTPSPTVRIHAFSLVLEGQKTVVLNMNLIPPHVRNRTDYFILSWIGSGSADSNFARYILLHELGHLCLHADSCTRLTNGPLRVLYSFVESKPVRIDCDGSSEEEIVEGTRAEIEADLFAAVAMVPDKKMARFRTVGLGVDRDAVIGLLR